MKNFYLHSTVVIGGASVLALEILGTRIIGPFYGVSLYLWSVLITVTLLSLSVGYSFGGKLADKYPAFNRLNTIIAIAGIWVLLIPWIKHPLLSSVEPMGLRPAVLLATFVLFFPPLTLLGMVSPYALKLKATEIQNLGRTAGNLYALSTFASVIAALATSSFLVPYVGVNKLTILIGVLLIALAVAGYILSNNKAIATLLLPAMAVAIWGVKFPPGEVPKPEQGLLAVQQSQYAELRVIDAKDSRHLLLDGSLHAQVDLKTFASNYPYVSIMDLPMYFHQSPGKMLLIGLGAGSLAKNYAAAGWKVDAVEIDPVVVQLAETYFNLKPDEAAIFPMDGRQFLNQSDGTYDVIILDAFGGGSIPFHLITAEVFALMKSHLTPDGTIGINVEALGWHDIIVRSVAATLQTSFSNVIALPIAEPPTEFGNVVLFASDRKFVLEQEITRDYSNPDFRFSSNYWKVHGWDNLFEPNTRNAPVLTDDRNPIDVWSEDINYASRKSLHSYFSDVKNSW